MGKKKGKNTQKPVEEDANGDGSLTELKVPEQTITGKAGKKGKRKQFNDDEIEDDFMELVNEQGRGLEDPASIVKSDQTTPTMVLKENIMPEKNDSTSTAKKGKKKKSKKNDDWEDEVAEEIEKMAIGDTNEDKQEEQLVAKIQPPAAEEKKQDTTTTAIKTVDEGGDEMEEDVETVVHIKTKAEKKSAKKEKQKEKKKKTEQKDKKPVTLESMPSTEETSADTTTGTATGTTTDTMTDTTTDTVTGTDSAVDIVEEDEDDDKKKKKKKKKKEDEKKGAKGKKKPGGLLKIKEEIEALRAAQKKREEEELEKQRKAEEEERLRLEKIRLEKERKEKKKQKEKERKERLRKEGKILSKSEKEKRAKQAIQMAALVEQGLVLPPQRMGGASEGEKKPVRYGSRVRNKKNKSQQEKNEVSESGIEDDLSTVTTPPESVVSESLTMELESNEDNVKENWDDESEEEEDHDDSSDTVSQQRGEDDLPSLEHPSPLDKGVTSMKSQEEEEDEEGGDSDDSSEEEESDSDDDDDDDDDDDESMTPYDRAAKRIQARRQKYASERSSDLLRSPVVCVLGHVDTGKTKILDKIRHTNVQDGEAGGITQQIGATFVPEGAIKEQTKCMKEFSKSEFKVPGLLIIDTPGHESFSNLRNRGSSMCDIAILVVDIMHGLEPQTIESLQLLKKGKVPFIVALNKIDRLFDWRRTPTSSVKETIKRQKPNTKLEFDERVAETIAQFAEKMGLNAALYWDKVDFTEYIPLVPTSAISGDGMGDLIAQIITYSEKYLVDKLMLTKEVEALVLEVKVIGGLGTTIDVILRNGILNESDTMILTGTDGPFVAQARALLMPQPLRELRVKNAYVNHKTVIASQGVKICGKDLEKTLAGTPVFIAKKDDEIEVLKNEATASLSGALNAIKLKEKGVFVQASTLGSLEALLEFLKTSKIPYAGINIGPVHRKDVMKASAMLEKDNQWACILAFDVRVERDAQEMADNLGVKIFTADIIYHLFDSFMKHREELKEKRRRENEHIAIFPCKLRILPNCIFNARNPIVVGVMIEAGVLKPGTPLCVPSKEFVNIGTVSSLEVNHKQVEIARKGEEVCIKIEASSGEAPKLYGRHFTLDDLLVSKISRESIDACKSFFRDDLQKSDWQLMIELKKLFHVY